MRLLIDVERNDPNRYSNFVINWTKKCLMLKNPRVALAVPAGHYITQQINKCLHDV